LKSAARFYLWTRRALEISRARRIHRINHATDETHVYKISRIKNEIPKSLVARVKNRA